MAVLQDDFKAPISASATDRAGEPVPVTFTVGDETGESGDPVLRLEEVDGVTYVVPNDTGTGTVIAHVVGLDDRVLDVEVVTSNAVSINFTLGEPVPRTDI